MRTLVQWSVRNSPAMNTLLLAAMLLGAGSIWTMRREVFPEFELEILLISVPYPGASTSEVEEGICQKIEEAVQSTSGIKRLTSIAQEGIGYVVLELETSVRDVQKILTEVRGEVDRIPSFPELAEDPQVKQITLRQPAIRVGIIGPETDQTDAEWQLRELSEQIRSELLLLPSVSQANLVGARPYQIDIEISEHTLRKHGLTLKRIAEIVRRENVELPGGLLRTQSQEVRLRGMSKSAVGEEIARIPLITQPDGVVLTVADLGQVRDGFEDVTAISEVNGRPAIVVSVDRTANEDLLAITEEVNRYVAGRTVPAGYELTTWSDRSVDVRDRMELLLRNGLQGLALVFVALAVFLELRLAFWVALGIPVAILGAGAWLYATGHTLNMLTMFAFLMALGIVVDDAIVIGENIHAHRQRGSGRVRAAIDGTLEVLPSVLASVSTTIIAFSPLLFVSGVMGKFIAVMPVAVIAMLVISILESTFILPAHLAHEHSLFFRTLSVLLFPLRPLGAVLVWLNRRTTSGLEWLIERGYVPLLRWGLRRPGMLLATAAALLVGTLGMVRSGLTPFVIFPKIDSNFIEARVTFPDGTPAEVTRGAIERIEQAIRQVDQRYANEGMPIVRLVYRAAGQVTTPGALGPETRTNGSHVGQVSVELVDTSQRNVKSEQIINEWRAAAGKIEGAERATFSVEQFGPGGTPIEFKLLADSRHMPRLEAAAARLKARLAEYPGVFDIRDDLQSGKWELLIQKKETAHALDVTNADLAETVRAAYWGEEVMRLQRGRHEVKLMVRYPVDERKSLAAFDEIRVRAGDGAERPITELADIELARSYAEINRVDQQRAITLSADVDESRANARQIVRDLKENFVPDLLAEFPELNIRWEGQQEQTEESVQSLLVGLGVALLGMFVLLTFEFRSYFQPALIMIVIPFGMVGAVWGHAAMGIPLTMFSLFGIVALTGVVVNDSIVLIDFINHRVRDGMPLVEALVEAGRRRFRPVLLTSVTTIAGLLPILTERSFQAQILIPMALALSAGLTLATVLVLVLVPVLYQVYVRFTGTKTGFREADDWERLLQERAAEEPAASSTTTG
jgi:hydrophobic/amphiphilic exporter-1 (mainly G- bacteria), HAE1 family